MSLSGGRGWWLAVAALLVAGALLARGISAEAIDWQPAVAFVQPWRAWSAVWVHYSDLHLAANLAGALLVALLGAVARLPSRAATAWLLAWPATQLALLIEPALLHYGGLSGVLHAGVAIVGVHLMRGPWTARRRVGWLLLAGLAAKVLLEAPWRGPLQHPPGWDIAIAPLAHASGTLAGLLASVLLFTQPVRD